MNNELANRLGPMRAAVLGLHRELLAAERIAWEAMNGRVPGNGEFLQLVVHDPWFQWLRPMTALIAAMDEAMTDEAPEAAARVTALVAAARELLHPNEMGNDFQQRYFEFIQRSPDVAVAHGIMMRDLFTPNR
jgi:hypothetical protein